MKAFNLTFIVVISILGITHIAQADQGPDGEIVVNGSGRNEFARSFSADGFNFGSGTSGSGTAYGGGSVGFESGVNDPNGGMDSDSANAEANQEIVVTGRKPFPTINGIDTQQIWRPLQDRVYDFDEGTQERRYYQAIADDYAAKAREVAAAEQTRRNLQASGDQATANRISRANAPRALGLIQDNPYDAIPVQIYNRAYIDHSVQQPTNNCYSCGPMEQAFRDYFFGR